MGRRTKTHNLHPNSSHPPPPNQQKIAKMMKTLMLIRWWTKTKDPSSPTPSTPTNSSNSTQNMAGLMCFWNWWLDWYTRWCCLRLLVRITDTSPSTKKIVSVKITGVMHPNKHSTAVAIKYTSGSNLMYSIGAIHHHWGDFTSGLLLICWKKIKVDLNY